MAYSAKEWNRSRKEKGICIECDQPTYNNTYRCHAHTLENRQRAAQWKAQNNDHKLDLDRMRRIILLAGRICYCKERNPIKEGYRLCDKCLERQRKHGNRYQRYWVNLQIKYETRDLGNYTGHRATRVAKEAR